MRQPDVYPADFGAIFLANEAERQDFIDALQPGGEEYDESPAIMLHPDHPDIVVRRQRRRVDGDPETVMELLRELQVDYGIPVAGVRPLTTLDLLPVAEVPPEPKPEYDFLYWAVDRIAGPSLYFAGYDNVPTEEMQPFLQRLTSYLVDKCRTRQPFMDDIFKPRQWRYGPNARTGDPTLRLQLVDVGPHYTIAVRNTVFTARDWRAASHYPAQIVGCILGLDSLMRASQGFTGATYDEERNALFEAFGALIQTEPERERLIRYISHVAAF